MKSYFDPNTGECLYCHGSGYCPHCDGDGEVLDRECQFCNGLGDCPVCKGDGEREMPELVDVDYDWPSNNRRHRPRRRISYRERRTFDDNYPCPIPRSEYAASQRQALDILFPDVKNFNGHCRSAIARCGFSQAETQRLIKLLPGEISYDQYIAVQGLADSHHGFDVVNDQLLKIFYPWWRRMLIGFFNQI